MSPRRPAENPRLAPFGVSIFAEMSRLAVQHGAVNLGQGFPDFQGPELAKRAAKAAIDADKNQYARSAGDPTLVKAIARHLERHYGLAYDPLEEVTVHSGCTEAIFSAILALCGPGDEVVLFEPFYDSYRAVVALSGATAKVVTLEDPTFRWAPGALERAFSDRTRLVLLNTPHNPTGRVFDRSELEAIARLAIQHDCYVASDEVYEHLVFEGKHVPIASLPGMRERTLTLGSSGKTFSMTGWKVGWSVGPRDLAASVRSVHQFVTFATATPFQHAMAEALDWGREFYDEFLAAYRVRRERICSMLADAGFAVRRPQGTYFAVADVRPLGFDDGATFCRFLVEEIGVAAIPMSAFYENTAAGKHLVRFAFCKSDATLDAAAERLKKLAARRR
jgi:N-succinyldiaminopimelate aminotransferase